MVVFVELVDGVAQEDEGLGSVNVFLHRSSCSNV